MATRRVELGPTAETVRFNVRRYRESAGLTLRGLAELLAVTDRPLSHTVLSQIETGGRRVDVDDLVALSIALGVNPNALLFPPIAGGADLQLTGRQAPADQVWSWALGERPLDSTPGRPPRGLTGQKDIQAYFAAAIERSGDRFRERVTPDYPEDPGPNVTYAGPAHTGDR